MGNKHSKKKPAPAAKTSTPAAKTSTPAPRKARPSAVASATTSGKTSSPAFVQWYWQDQFIWNESNASDCDVLEKAYQRKVTGQKQRITVSGRTYMFDFDNMEQENVSTHVKRKVRRGDGEDGLAMPPLTRSPSLEQKEEKQLAEERVLADKHLTCCQKGRVESDLVTSSDYVQFKEVTQALFERMLDQGSESLKAECRPVSNRPTEESKCLVCFSDFTHTTAQWRDMKNTAYEEGAGHTKFEDPPLDEDEPCFRVTMEICGCSMICSECLGGYLVAKGEEKEVLPWIVCPAESCSVPVHYLNIIDALLPLQKLYSVLSCYTSAVLSQSELWIPCETKACPFGLLESTAITEGKDTCRMCNEEQKWERKEPELDDGFQAMIDEGKMRPCPKCQYYQIKDFGMCNVMRCPKCGIYWNWKTKIMAQTYGQCKSLSRNNGSMWEPGELEFQQDLQRNKPQEFKALLERNGIEYKENFVRGRD